MFRLSLVLSKVFQYMTPDYIYHEMTWAEVNDTLQYVYSFDVSDKFFIVTENKKTTWQKAKKLSAFWKRETQDAEKQLMAFKRKLKAGN